MECSSCRCVFVFLLQICFLLLPPPPLSFVLVCVCVRACVCVCVHQTKLIQPTHPVACFRKGGLGSLSENTISDNRLANVLVADDGSNPSVSGNTVSRSFEGAGITGSCFLEMLFGIFFRSIFLNCLFFVFFQFVKTAKATSPATTFTTTESLGWRSSVGVILK